MTARRRDSQPQWYFAVMQVIGNDTILAVVLSGAEVIRERDAGTGLFRNSVVQNRWVWYAIALSFLLVAAAASLPGLTTVLGVVPLDLSGWLRVLAGSLVPLVVGQTMLSLASRAQR